MINPNLDQPVTVELLIDHWLLIEAELSTTEHSLRQMQAPELAEEYRQIRQRIHDQVLEQEK